jgi:VWFA-related protein
MRRSLVALAISTAAAVVLVAQDQLPQPTFRAEANYVRVDVFPTRNGAPVTDLTAADFEVIEDRAPQKIEQFEHVVIRAAGVGEGRPEPNTVAQSLQAIQDPRARVFVLFLDPAHVELGTSKKISQTLVNTLNRLMGPDDYVGFMVPPMTLRDVTFARRTVVIQHLLERDWWGKRDSMFPQDEVEEQYAYCYDARVLNEPAIGNEMILRHREQQTFDALEDLVLGIRNLREERKAVLAITDGWLIYRPNPSLARPLGGDKDTAPGNPPIGVDPRNGKLSTADPNSYGQTALRKCELDRQVLANLDDETRMRTIIDEANRANTSFYPVDPRGLAVFDESIVPSSVINGSRPPPMLPLQQESAQLRAREQGLRQLADGTDGLAVVATNNIEPALRRVVADLSSYYLLGYYSTGKLDGRFHSITVRVKRQGVTVRARRGYQALRESDLTVGTTAPVRAAAAATTNADAAMAVAASSAVAKIVNSARDLPLRVHATAGWRRGPDGKPVAVFWTVGEVVDRTSGADLDAMVLNSAGDLVSSVKARIMPGTTSTRLAIVPDGPVSAGDYTVRVKSQGPAGSETVSLPVALAQAPSASGAMFVRRGPTTGNKDVPTADVRFRRSERVRVEVPSPADITSARLLDKTGKPISAIPVTAATRTDADGVKWATADVLLAPLAPGDYIVEVVAGETRTLAAFRIVP